MPMGISERLTPAGEDTCVAPELSAAPLSDQHFDWIKIPRPRETMGASKTHNGSNSRHLTSSSLHGPQ